jgi:GAF domain-containing protein
MATTPVQPVDTAPVEDSGSAEDLAQLAIALHDEPTVTDTVDRVLEYAVAALDCDYAGVIFVHAKKRVETAAATDPLIEKLDLIQLECGEGPDVEVLDSPAGPYGVLVTDTHSDYRWPNWANRVATHGIRSLISVRMYTSATTVGTLNLYDREPNKFSLGDVELAHLLARHAAVALAAARTAENLWQAVDARKLIGQAQGILMERYSLNADKAFAVLMRYSQQKNVKLRDVAQRLVDDRQLMD